MTRVGAACIAVFLASACTTFSKDGGFDTVSNAAEARLGKKAVAVRSETERDAVARQTAELLAKPLSIDDAVQLALLNNRGLQAAYSELGLSEADLVQAGRLPNPGFTFSRTHWSDSIGISRSFSMSVLSVLTLPMATRIERGRFEQTKLETANAMLTVAADARRAYVEAIAAEQAAVYAKQIGDSAEAGAELARRMRDAGNASKLDYAREQAFYAQSVADVAKARQQAVAAREKLTRAMGLWGGQTRYALPDKLPDLPKDRPRFDDLERFAIENRLDIQAAKLRTQSVASSLGLTKAVRFVNALDAGYLNNFETDKGHERGYEIGIEIPIFDWGSAKVARAQAIYLQSVDRLAQTAVDARSQVRESYAASLASYDVAKHFRDEIVPLRKTISDEVLLRYNGMLASTFELLADAREQVSAVNGYIGALKDYWLADTDLRQALGGNVPPPASVPAPASAPVGTPAADASPSGPPAPAAPAAGSGHDESAHAAHKPAAAAPHEQDH
ncbi:TolC family protein [Trinickia caryophylli]|uniref:Outer membrane protein TolC n=1 Tax=Trinickia caryophylli TaxID=28094 RepID=A0A1X7G7Q1_TRICW|nr:TolC family protein [Trinickia caryophylli]PMS11443.1 TolC family protein [Trinickia caryophylli]TRX20204.1 TolC family protein [Trinickia caryophylli]WQE13787.1 TolC family protein [Trinickia caryophylli]SMF65451.1 Outer membrane protein TolC [Trinickia caryophylli]